MPRSSRLDRGGRVAAGASDCAGEPGRSRRRTPTGNGAIEVRDPQAAYIDMAQLRAALGQVGVDPDVVWAKLAAMAEEGADRLAQVSEILSIRLG